MKKITIITFVCILLSLLPKVSQAQFINNIEETTNPVKKIYYNDGILAVATYYGDDKLIDSLKTNYKNGNKKEIFYYTKGRKNGNSYQFSIEGEKIVTWQFENDLLVERIDHKIEFNKKNEERIRKIHTLLLEANKQLKINQKNIKAFHQRAHARYVLGNTTLALADYTKLEKLMHRLPEGKNFPEKIAIDIYDSLGGLFSSAEMENQAIHFRLKAINIATKKERLQYNLGNYLYSIKSYRLAENYLTKVLETWPKHAFSHWALGSLYSDLNQNEKAMEHINIAYEREEGLYSHGIGASDNTVRTVRGLLYHKLGDSEKGILDLEEALDINKNNSFALRNLGVIYHDMGQYDKACNLLQKSKELGYEKIYDNDDLQSYLEAACLEKKSNKELLKIPNKPYAYPNPAVDIISLKNYISEKYSYTILNYNSKLILAGSTDNNSIDTSTLTPDVYILNINNNGETVTFKIIKTN